MPRSDSLSAPTKDHQTTTTFHRMSGLSASAYAPPQHKSNTVTSKSWGSRLKPVRQDPLESIGLVSKGDTRLLDPKTQRTYFQTIQERWHSFCAQHSLPLPSSTSAKEADTLSTALSSLSLTSTSSSTSTAPTSTSATLSLLTLSLRKLREALLASASSSSRTPGFAADVLAFSVRFGILTSQASCYGPALSHLLSLFRRPPRDDDDDDDDDDALSATLRREMQTYYVLDLASRQARLCDAFDALYNFSADSAGGRCNGAVAPSTRGFLLAMARGDFATFWRLWRRADGYERRVLGEAERRMRLHAVKCVGRAYLRVGRGWLEERVLGGMGVEEARGTLGLGWDVVGEEVVVRRVKGGAGG